MSGYLLSGVLAAMFAVQAGPAPARFRDVAWDAQTQKGAAAPAAAKAADKEIRLNGCIARDKVAPGQFTFQDNDGGGKYHLTGKGLKSFVGHRVEIVGGPPGKKVTFRTGLLPSPNVAAQAGAIDPAQAAVANLPGGAADGNGLSPLPEFHVVRLRGLEGSCQ
jgi:hypothetical protein